MPNTYNAINAIVKHKKLNILLIDDSVSILKKMQEMLLDSLCIGTVDIAVSATDAYEYINTTLPNLILLDINMPGKNGIELLREIKQNHPNVKVMMVTNQSVDYYKPICKDLGADYFIDKSTEFEMIPEIIEQVCAEINN